MKKCIKFLVIIFVAVTATDTCIDRLFPENRESAISLLSNNVEALAEGEHIGLYVCYGSGSIDCPSGLKVKYYFNNTR